MQHPPCESGHGQYDKPHSARAIGQRGRSRRNQTTSFAHWNRRDGNKIARQSQAQGGRPAMLEAVPIDIALWGMIVCLAIKTAQWIAIAF